MKVAAFHGCSFTSGAGWDNDNLHDNAKDCPELWVNLCYNNIPKLKKLNLLNLSNAGSSNTDIFESVISTIAKEGNNIDTLFVQWTAGPRYKFNIGFELWCTQEDFFQSFLHDVNLSDGTCYSRKYLQDLTDRLLVLHHLHWEIVKILRYTDTITNLANRIGIANVFFINGLCPWDENYFDKLENVLPEQYTPFTKNKILQIDYRNDEDIFKLYNIAHTHYQEAGKININDWINLYNSFLNNRIDYNFDNLHPGIKSNQQYFKIVKTSLENLGYI